MQGDSWEALNSDPTRAGAGMGWEQWREMKQFQLYFGKNGDKA